MVSKKLNKKELVHSIWENSEKGKYTSLNNSDGSLMNEEQIYKKLFC
jgi:hypothetical protein